MNQHGIIAGALVAVVVIVIDDDDDSFVGFLFRSFVWSVVSLFVVNIGETAGFTRQQWQTPGLSWMLE